MSWHMLGHEWAVDLLHEHVVRNEVRHAYLFSGPQGLGRRTLALRLAQALNCVHPLAPGEPCGQCRACTQIENMQHPDLAVVQAETQGGTLKVEQVRELQRSLALHPYEAQYRIALLLRFEEAHPSAMNALLKTLEEPAPKVVILLTAESSEILLPTIVSRCEVLRLRPVPVEIVSRGLQERWNLPPDQARLLAHISGGRPGYALRLSQDPEQLERRRNWLDDHSRLLMADRVSRFAYVESITKDRDKDVLRGILSVWLSLWRDVLLRAAGASAVATNLDCLDDVDRLATRLGMHNARLMTASIERTLELVDKNINARLALEVLMLDLPRL